MAVPACENHRFYQTFQSALLRMQGNSEQNNKKCIFLQKRKHTFLFTVTYSHQLR